MNSLVKIHLLQNVLPKICTLTERNIATTSCLMRSKVAARPKRTKNQSNAVTFEELMPAHAIQLKKGFNSFNTSNLLGESRSGETAIEDLFIRKFMAGTWHKMLLSKIIIKRRANMIFLTGIFFLNRPPTAVYFLQGYTEGLLSYVLKCPVKMEILTTTDPEAMIVARL
ncbi:mitochondrial ribosomal protein S24 [Brevipalpus obovatus]|uniref:mitochondrial ribosomal protein S24 n=1 Tax=Brevipalpus obovatus TaxID=246614 RepID=UPI003D9F9632